MNYDEFKEQVKDNILAHLGEAYANAKVELTDVHKNNITLSGVLIKSDDSNITPTIYLESFYKDYQEGEAIDSILDRIANTYETHNDIGNVDVAKLTNIEEIRDNIFPRVVGIEGNSEMLAARPYERMAEDLAIIYAVNVGKNGNLDMSVPISESLMKQYGLSQSELHEIAMNNMDQKMDIQFKGMNEVMKEIMLPDLMRQNGGDMEEALAFLENMCPPEEAMYVLSNTEKTNGAVTMFDTKTMDEIASKIEGDFYVIPSSIHEVIVVPMNEEMSFSKLESMVREVNSSEVSPEDRLSDNVYAYDAKEHELLRSDQYENRMNERANEPVLNTKKGPEKEETKTLSFKEQLRDAKKEANIVNETRKDKETKITKSKSTSMEI